MLIFLIAVIIVHGNALSFIYGKLFDNIVLDKHCENLCTSDLQFGFKKNRSTSMYVYSDFNETLSHYVNNESTV